MTRVIIQIIGLTLLCSDAFSTAIISGKISNCQSKEIRLDYFGGYYSMPAKYYLPDDLFQTINDDGEFKLEFETSNDYCCYGLSIDTIGCKIYLKDNDSIYITFDLKNIENTLKTYSNHNGLTNFFFVYDHFIRSSPKNTLPDEDVIQFFTERQAEFLRLIESFRSGKLQSFNSIEESKKILITKFINATNLNQDDYEILKNYSNKYISEAIYYTSHDYQLLHIDDFISLFKGVDFTNHFIFHDAWMQGLADDYVRLSCYKKYIEITDSVTIHDAYKYFEINEYDEAKELLSGEILEKYLSDRLYDLLLFGEYTRLEQLYAQSITLLTDDLYKNVVERFYHNYLYGLNEKDYNLNLPEHNLNDSSLMELFDSMKGHRNYLILWKVDQRTSYYLTPLSKVHELNKIQTSLKDKNIRFIDICLGDDNRRGQWASLIIQYKWRGEHYFISKQYEDLFRKLFYCQDRMKYCNSELYFIIDENGKLLHDNGDELIINLDQITSL